ncbi:MAG: ATP-binding protein [Defluviitaleaceae bacterium]|nr:ATP-binding protein [Defluviitaleaceae bacterium]
MKNKLDNQGNLRAVIRRLQKENSDLKMNLALAEANIAKKQVSDVRYLNYMLEGSTNIVFLLDTDRKFSYASKIFLDALGLEDFEQIRGKYYKDTIKLILSEKNLMRLSGAIHFAQTQSTSVPIDEEPDIKGIMRSYTGHVSPMTDEDGAIVGTMVLLNDVTEISNALEAAKNAISSKAKFLATMSHELRTPMNSIIGISDIELDRPDLPSDLADSFEKINSSGQTLLGIINDILDMSKMETGKMEILPNKYDTAAMINDITRLNLIRVEDKGLDLIVKVSEKLPASLIGDALRVKQAVNNVLSNAIKFTEYGSATLDVSSTRVKGEIRLIFTITDTGVGMTEEEIKSVLHEDITSFNHEFNRKKSGAGLGLSITKNLVDLMGGKIGAISEKDKGSVFTITLMQKAVEDAAAIGAETAESLQDFKYEGAQRAKVVREFMPYGRVLIVDDMNINLFVAKGLMTPYGLESDTALSGYEALDKIAEGQKYDIIFMDHMMPGIDGMETTIKLREQGYTLPIVALTANAVAGQDEIFLANGFNDFIAKPINTGQLNDVLNKHIRDKQTPETLEAARKQKEEMTAAAQPAQAAPVNENDPLTLLRKIKDMNVDSALRAMRGMTDLYLDTVKLTARLLPEKIDKMTKLLDSDMKSFTIEVHGIKSALNNIGAEKLGNSAAKLERAAKDDKKSYCDEYYPPFRDGLVSIHAALSEVFPDDTANKETADKSVLIPAIAEAKEAAENFDRDAASEAIGKHASFSFTPEIDELLSEITAALDSFDCDGALKKLEILEGIANG